MYVSMGYEPDGGLRSVTASCYGDLALSLAGHAGAPTNDEERCMTKIRAAVFEQPGQPLEVQELSLDEPRGERSSSAWRPAVSATATTTSCSESGRHLPDRPRTRRRGSRGGGWQGDERCRRRSRHPLVDALLSLVSLLPHGSAKSLRGSPPGPRTRASSSTAPRGCAGNGTTVYSYLTVGSFGERAVVPETGAIPIRRDAPLERPRSSAVRCRQASVQS